MPKKVLVVDEERHIVRLVESHLRRLGHDVLTAQDAHEALHKVETEKPDVILVGPTLPSRADLLRTLKANPATEKILVVGRDWSALHRS